MRAEVATAQQLPLLCAYMDDKIGVKFDPAAVQGFAIMSDKDVFVAGVLISNVRYHEGKAIDCEISCASESGIAWRPHVCAAVFGYVFKQLGCVRCTSVVRKNNVKSREFLEALNFELEGKLRLGYDGQKDALIYGLLASECRYFGGLNG